MINTTIVGRLNELRSRMEKENFDMILVTSSDFHGSEYVSDYFKVSEFFSGCTSDNVSLLILKDSAFLWTDARFFLSAGEELSGTGIKLMKSGEPGVPTLNQFLDSHLQPGMTLGYDGRTISCERGEMIRRIAVEKNAGVNGTIDPAFDIWKDRPEFPNGKISILSAEETGKDAKEKIAEVRECMQRFGAASLVLSKIDDIMWLFNIRGEDIPYNPVAIAYCIIRNEEAFLYIRNPESISEYGKTEGFSVRPYDTFFDDLEQFTEGEKVWIDHAYLSDRIMSILLGRRIRPLLAPYPTNMKKAVKNEKELERIRECYLRDSVILCKFLYYVQSHVGKEEMTEVSLAKKLDYMRSTIPDFIDLSFSTISAYGPNAAVVHYEPKEESCAGIKAEGFYLVDSGGQYESGTTDVTRTIALGEITEEMRRDFTYVAIANLRLLYAKFLYGCTGANLDMYARSILWENGVDFKHGTGHGIGYRLNVHEGPQNIAWKIISPVTGKISGGNAKTVFEPGMITSDEPGIYRDGKYGIRTETIIECVEENNNEYGRFLSFRPLTLVPIDLNAMNLSILDESDRKKLNAYHKEVYEKISPLITDPDELAWLKKATKEC